MEYRVLGNSGFSVPVLSFGTGTFGGNHPFFGKWGHSDVQEASRLVDICQEACLLDGEGEGTGAGNRTCGLVT